MIILKQMISYVHFDTVTYKVNTTLQNLGNVNHTITYEFIIPK